ncbi:MAG TPA: fatty acid desaturase [Polyangiales bacterium]
MAPAPFYAAWVARWLNDPRDAVFVGLIAQCLVFCACGVALFFAGPRLWLLAPLYWLALVGMLLDRFTLMLHCVSHRQLWKPSHRALNWLVPWVIGPFFGQTPDTYFAHHMGMHHHEENLEADLSSTMRFTRDRFGHWLRYWSRFLVLGLPELSLYMRRHGRTRLLRKIVVGEGVYWSVVAIGLHFRPEATCAVFLIPLVLIRTLMMMGNWGQHAFIAPGEAANPYLSSITCINSRYNRRCFNDGYHIGHHLQARAHWTELPQHFADQLAEYGRQDAIVFEGLDFFLVWLLLMTGRWVWLARAFVQLPGAPVRDQAQVVAFLQSRVQPLTSVVAASVEAASVAA